MSNIILPDDPDFDKPVIMGDPFEIDPTRDLDRQGITPLTKQAEMERQRSIGNFKYANTLASSSPENWHYQMMKTSQAAGVSNMMTQPMWFSPLHTPQNWQVASKRREVYQWSRFFYENEPKVAAAIDFYSRFPMNGFKLECLNPKILKYFAHHIVKKLKLNERFKEISSEYYMIGDVFVHTDIKCEICGGTGEDPDTGEKCDHPGGSLSRIFIMNPDWIEVQRSPLTDEPLIVLVPDEELQQIVHKRQPKAIYDRIPEHLKALILARAPIPLSNRTISHLKHMSVPYGTYGTSIIRRLFTTLAYKTKIMTANWIVAERLILPVRVVKIGSDNRPAATQDIADVQQQLANVANDPNMTIVTHHNFEYDWYGTQGKILQVTQEMEHIDKELLDGLMLNQALLNGEMCIPEEDRILTKTGFKNLSQITEDDEIATVIHRDKEYKSSYSESDTGVLEYQKPTAIHEYDWDGDLIHFQTDRIDFACTPNHRMLYQKRDHDEWVVDTADQVTDRAKFRKTVRWVDFGVKGGAIVPVYPDFCIPGIEQSIPYDDFLKIIAYYVSEGHIQKETRKERSTYGDPMSVQIAQTEKGKGWEDLCTLQKESVIKVSKTRHGFGIHNKKLAQFVYDQCGHLSHLKRVPGWIKSADASKLRLFLGYLINGDGALRTRDKHGPKKYYTYYTKSMQLRDDVMEISLKCGYFPRFRKRRNIWEITFSDYDRGQETITLESKKHKTITKLPYKGKVWCVTVPNSFIITERNGKLMISGNSGYQSAQVGVETLIRRIESWRQTLAEWAEDRIFKPIAEMQGFVDEKESEEVGETVFLYPTIKWNDLELKDKTQFHQLLNQLHDKQVISTQTLLEEFGFDYDQEVMRMRYEQAQMGPAGAMMPGMEGAGGGMPMGGGGAGGMPGGAASPAQGGMPGMGMDPMGGGGGGGMDMGGGMGGGMPAAAEGGKVTKKGKSKTSEAEEEAQPMMPIKLTSIEQKMAGMLNEVASTMGFSAGNIRMQYPFANPKGGKPFTMDFAFPTLKIDIEADGEIWHSASPDKMMHDKDRDYLLAQRGWTVLRFDDKVIEEAPHQVKATINSYIKQAMDSTKKIASTNNGVQPPAMVGYFIAEDGKLKDLQGNAVKYYKTLGGTSQDRIQAEEVFGGRSIEEYFATARKV